MVCRLFSSFNIGVFCLVLLLPGCNSDKQKILVIGDSISIGYTPHMKKRLSKIATVEHIGENAQTSTYGASRINDWIGDDTWDIIQFNWGLWDLQYKTPDNKDQKIYGQQLTTIREYKQNLESIVGVLKTKTNAELVFVTCTYVPEDVPNMFSDDVIAFNSAAKELMKKFSIPVIDIYDESRLIHQDYGMGTNDAHFTRKGSQMLSDHICDFIEEQFLY